MTSAPGSYLCSSLCCPSYQSWHGDGDPVIILQPARVCPPRLPFVLCLLVLHHHCSASEVSGLSCPVCRVLNCYLFHPDLWSWISSHPLLETADSLPSLVPKTCYFSATSMARLITCLVYCDTRCVLSPFSQSDGRTF